MHAVILLCLFILASCFIDPAVTCASPATAVSPGSTISAAQERKERVPKKEKKSKEPREREEGDEDRYHDDDYEDEEERDCLTSCFFEMLSNSFSSSDDRADEEHALVDTVYVAPETYALAPEAPDAEYEMPAYVAPDHDQPRRLCLSATFGAGKCGPSAVWGEYKDGGWRLGIGAAKLFANNLQSGLSVGFTQLDGEPLFEYESATQLDSPSNSRIRIVDIGWRTGQYLGLSQGAFVLHWSVGPALYWVKERADLRVYSLPDLDILEDRRETLERWRVGGDFVFGMNWRQDSGPNIGFVTRCFVIPWAGEELRSLTLDYIGKRSVIGFTIGFAVSHDGF